MVVKPENTVTRHQGKLVQPGVKCRGLDYLRLIYGPTYPEQLEQLRERDYRLRCPMPKDRKDREKHAAEWVQVVAFPSQYHGLLDNPK
jgi:PNKP adenylyltransferase domain, ligase domain